MEEKDHHGEEPEKRNILKTRNRNNRQNQDPEEIVRNQFSIGVGRINFRKKRERYSSSKLGNILL